MSSVHPILALVAGVALYQLYQAFQVRERNKNKKPMRRTGSMAKRALLIGCNYPGKGNVELKGCVNDVWAVKDMLIKHFGFLADDICIMVDTDKSFASPTGRNIKKKLSELVRNSGKGDILYMHFSGHGVQVPEEPGENEEEDGKDEAIVPTDMNLVQDDDLRAILTKAPDGVKFTFTSDCCHSGTMLDHPEVQIEGKKNAREDAGYRTSDYIHNRDLPIEYLHQFLSQQTGGEIKSQTTIKTALLSQFGEDASDRAKRQIERVMTRNEEGYLESLVEDQTAAKGLSFLHSEENSTLNGKEKMYSTDGLAYLTLKSIGNFLVAKLGQGAEQGGSEILWKSDIETEGTSDDVQLVLTQEGDLEVVKDGETIWSSQTAGKGTGPYKLKLYKSGHLALKDASGVTLWSAGAPAALDAAGGPAEEIVGEDAADKEALEKLAKDGGQATRDIGGLQKSFRDTVSSFKSNVLGGSYEARGSLAPDFGVLITGCQSFETSADARPPGQPDKAYGAMSNALTSNITSHFRKTPNEPLTYMMLVKRVRATLAKEGFSQNPCLECSKKMSNTTFIYQDAIV